MPSGIWTYYSSLRHVFFCCCPGSQFTKAAHGISMCIFKGTEACMRMVEGIHRVLSDVICWFSFWWHRCGGSGVDGIHDGDANRVFLVFVLIGSSLALRKYVHTNIIRVFAICRKKDTYKMNKERLGELMRASIGRRTFGYPSTCSESVTNARVARALIFNFRLAFDIHKIVRSHGNGSERRNSPIATRWMSHRRRPFVYPPSLHATHFHRIGCTFHPIRRTQPHGTRRLPRRLARRCCAMCKQWSEWNDLHEKKEKEKKARPRRRRAELEMNKKK